MATRKRKSRSNPELDKIRAEVLNEQRKATRKIARLRREKGAMIMSTSYDPRAAVERVARMTGRQLEAKRKELQEFNSRRTQFVGLAGGEPAPAHLWRTYKRVEETHNSIGRERMSQRGHLKPPGSGMTIQEREDTMRSKIKARGSAVNRPYNEITREAYEINGVDKLDKLIKDMEAKNGREFIPKNIAAQREQLKQMFLEIGAHDRIADVDALSDHQFDVLFNDTNFANTVSLKYSIIMSQNEGNGRRSDEQQSETADADIEDFFNWVRKDVPKEAPTKPTTQNKRRK